MITAMTTRTLTLPREEIRPAWRAAVLAYRRELRGTREDRLAWPAAYAAFREVLPEMPEAQAKHETTHAIAFAAANHSLVLGRGLRGQGMSRSYDDEALKPLHPRLEPPRPRWVKWMALAILAASVAGVTALKWLLTWRKAY
jgi:hypothetical protein